MKVIENSQRNKIYNSGQAMIIILLIMGVVLTIGLSIISQSVVDIHISQQEEESARAFSAAEAGLESLLATGQAPSNYEGFAISTDTQNLGESQDFVFPTEVKADEIQTVWLVGHNADSEPDPMVEQFSGSEIRIFWGDRGTLPNNSDTPALEATLYYRESGNYRTRKYTADPNTNRRANNNFDSAEIGNYTLQGKTFRFRKIIQNLPSGLYALRLKLIYNRDQPHILGVRGVGSNIPLQGGCYKVTATSPTTGISRKIQQCQLYKVPPAIFDYVFFSETGL